MLCSNIACENWHQQTGTGYGIVEECEGSQVISWAGHGFNMIFDILMVIHFIIYYIELRI